MDVKNTSINYVRVNGFDCVALQCGKLKALVAPNCGANILALKDMVTGQSYLRTPKSAQEYSAQPEAYGMPILFPPNLLPHGTFTYGKHTYQLPLNNGDKTSNLHGLLSRRPWKEQITECTDEFSAAQWQYACTKSSEVYTYFPHLFCATVKYILTQTTLQQIISFKNNGDTDMPFMLGVHTSFSVPFSSEGKVEDYAITISAGDCVDRENFLPTGRILPASEQQKAFRDSRTMKKGEIVFDHLINCPVTNGTQSLCGAKITNNELQQSLRYDVDEKFKFWVLWNDDGNKDFICIEPQTCMINAANLQECDHAGFDVLKAHETISFTSKISI